MRSLTSAAPPCGGGGGRCPTAPPAGCSRLSAVDAAITAAALTEIGNVPALLVFCKHLASQLERSCWHSSRRTFLRCEPG